LNLREEKNNGSNIVNRLRSENKNKKIMNFEKLNPKSKLRFRIADYFWAIFSNSRNKNIKTSHFFKNIIKENLSLENVINKLNDIRKIKFLIFSQEISENFKTIKYINDFPTPDI